MKDFKNKIEKFETDLEKRASLITEAISDVIFISNNNSYEDAMELIKTQFLVVDKQDIDELDEDS